MILSGSSWPWKFNPQKYNWSPKTRKLLKNKFLGSKWSVILMRVKQSEVYDKVLVTEFCGFLTRRGTVRNFWFFGALKKYFKKKKSHHFSRHTARFGSSWWSEWRLSPGQYEWYDTLGENNKTNSRNNAPCPQKTTPASTWLWLWWQIKLQAYNKCCSSNKVIATRAKVWLNNEYCRN